MSVFSQFQEIIERFCPATCLLCRAKCHLSERLCRGCINDLPANKFACFCCAESLSEESAEFLCGACQKGGRPFWRCIAPLVYQYPVAEMLQSLKYRQMLAYAAPLAKYLSEIVRQAYIYDRWPEVMIPMPLHTSRLNERGFNQAGVIARHLSSLLSIPVKHHLTNRVKPTPPLTNLSAKARKRVLSGVFDAGVVNFDHVVLIDDIMTSGASVEAVCRTLQKSGVRRIDVWCIARTSTH